MGNKHPSEYNGATCSSCGRSLPPMRSFDNLQNTTIDGRAVYIFNNGQYYRWHGCSHQCPDCFFRPKREREERERRERRERERKEEEERRRRQEQETQRQEREKQEAMNKLANEKAKNLEQESNKWHHQNESKSINRSIEQNTFSRFIPRFDENGDENEENVEPDANEEFYYLFVELYGYELDYLDLNELSHEDLSEIITPLKELMQDVWLSHPPSNRDLITVVQCFSLKIYLAAIREPTSNDTVIENEINFIIQKISESAQSVEDLINLTVSILTTAQNTNDFLPLGEVALSNLCRSLEDENKELSSEKHLNVVETISLDFLENLLLNSIRTFPQLQGNPIIQVILSQLVEKSVGIFEYGDCSLMDSFSNLTRSEKWDPKSVWVFLRALIQQCSSIKEEVKHYCQILHIISTYCIGPNQIIDGHETILDLTRNVKARELSYQMIAFADEIKDQIKELDVLLEEMNETKLIDTASLKSTRDIITSTKIKLGKYGYPGKGKTELFEEFLSKRSINEWKEKIQVKDAMSQLNNNLLEDSLTLLSCVVNKINGWWPRDTQFISWCVLMLTDGNGKLLQMNTGEGKSCVVAMFAAMLSCQSKFVDVITSSPILAVRDAEEWANFYSVLGVTVTNNIKTTDDRSRNKCYQANIVYGTVANFASDVLRQEFHMKNIRPNRTFDSVIVDEVDSLLLDQGVQFTYLSHETPGLNHLNPVLAMVWCAVSQFTALQWESDVMWCAPPQPFFRALYDTIDPSGSGVTEPLQLLRLGETSGLLSEGFAERYESAPETSNKESIEIESKQDLLRQVDIETIIKFFVVSEEYFPCNYILYFLDEDNRMAKINRAYNSETQSERIDIHILVVGPGVCCILSESEIELREPIVEQIKKTSLQTETSQSDEAISNIPKYLHPFIEHRLSTWVENAFIALKMQEGREYLVKDDKILPIDYKNTGIIERNKKWSNGLHQFIQMKHKKQLAPLSVVTNFISNFTFFQRYHHSLYGMTGTLGNTNDHSFLSTTYAVKLVKIPTFCAQKLFEYEGILCPSRDSWENSITAALKQKIASKSWKGKGRAALVICEDINSATELQKIIVEKVSPNVKLYIRNDSDQLNIIHHKLEPQEIIVATNLAGRGTNIKVQSDVKESGGLFVLLTSLPQNARVERQAFGRTARKGDPGSVQMIVNIEDLPENLLQSQSIANASYLRDKLLKESIRQNDVEEVNLKEKLFAEYCALLQPIHQMGNDDEEKKILASTLNEFWGMWLLANTNKFDQVPESELIDALKKEISIAKADTLEKKSPSNNFYHSIKFGNEVLLYDYDYQRAQDLYSQAISTDSNWSVIAYYNRAYCRIKQASGNYIVLAIEDLEKALESFKNYKEQELITLQLNNSSISHLKEKEVIEETALTKQITSKFQVYNFYEKNIQEAIGKLRELKDDDVEAVESSIFSLVTESDPQTHAELYSLWQHGLLNVYSIKKKPRFCWEGLVVFLLGALQVIGGIALTVFSAGTLSNIGMGLIVEGVSDIMDGVIAMVTEEFSWEQWAISKAIGIATSLIGFGVGKIISKGFKGVKLATKAFSKELKALPKIIRSQTKGGLTQVMKVNMKNAGKYAGKELVEEGVLRGLQFAQDKIVEEFMGLVKQAVKSAIETKVSDSIFKGGLGASMDELVLQQIDGIENSYVLTKTDGPSERLERTLVNFGSKLLDSYMKDLGWQNQLNTALQGTMLKVQGTLAKDKKLNKYQAMFEVAEAVHMGALLIDATSSITSLLNEFDAAYSQDIEDFMKETYATQYDLSNPIQGNDNFTQLKRNIANSITELLSEAIVTVVHQKFTSYIVTKAQKKMNGKVVRFVGNKLLKGTDIENKLKAGEASLFISSVGAHHESGDSKVSERYATEIKDSKTPGSILDLRILSEKLAVKITILEEQGDNKFRKMMNIEPDSLKNNSQRIQLVYRPSSKDYPDGHYDVLQNNKVINVDSENKNCSYHALSKALHPSDTDEKNRARAIEFRKMEANELVTNTGKWNRFIQMKEKVENLTNAMWYLGIGGAKKKAKKRKLFDDKDPSDGQIREAKEVRGNQSQDVLDNLKRKFQEEAKERWETIVGKPTDPKTYIDDGNQSKGIQIQMKYKNSKGEDLTNKQLLETLAFYHEKGEQITGKLCRLKVEMNFGGENHKFIMEKATWGVRQILIDTLNGDYPSSTSKKNSYDDFTDSLDEVGGKPKEVKDMDKYEKEKKEIIKERARMISKAIASTKNDQPDFNQKYKSKVDGEERSYFTEQQKRAAVSLIAITQIAEPCAPDSKFRLMLLEPNNTKLSVSEVRSISALDPNDKFVKNPGEDAITMKKRKDDFDKHKIAINTTKAEVITEAITTDKMHRFDEIYKKDGRDYKYFSDKQIEAVNLYILARRINEGYHPDSDPADKTKSQAELQTEITKEINSKKGLLGFSVAKTGRVPGMDKYAVDLLDLMGKSDYEYDFKTMFGWKKNGDLPLYSPASTTDNARLEFYENRK